MISTALIGLAVVAGLMTAVWVVSLVLADVSIVDYFWGLGFVVVAWTYHAVAGAATPRSLLVLALVTVWGVRLSAYLVLRNRGQPEDYRYAEMRATRGDAFPVLSLFIVFWLQAFLLWVVAMALLASISAGAPPTLTWIDALGAVCFGVGFFFEVVGDAQLARFKADPRNKGTLLTAGLWRYTRHPNYFGEAMMWWGFYAFAVAVGAGWWTIVSPILMTVLLLKVSGVALLERGLAQTKPGYEEYVRRTNAFIPWFPRA